MANMKRLFAHTTKQSLAYARRKYSQQNPKKDVFVNTLKEDTASDHATILVLSGAFATILGYATYYVGTKIQYQYESKDWPSVVGRLEYCSYTTTRSGNVQPLPSFVQYSYRLGFVSYSGNTLSHRVLPDIISTSTEDEQHGRRIYNSNTPVKVYYNPRNPDISCLQPSTAIGYEDVALLVVLSLCTLLPVTGVLKRTIGLGRALINKRKSTK